MTHGGIEHRGLILGSKSVLQPTGEDHPFLTRHHQQMVEKIIPLEKNHKVGVELVEINALPIDHTDESAIGFKFYCPKFTLSYTADTIVTPHLLESLMGTDILILNVPHVTSKNGSKNLSIESAIQIVSHVRPKLVILTHFSLEMLKNDPIQAAREVQRITGVQAIAAQDGLAISPEGYGKYPSPIKGWD
jgi:ribonuclease BN (tRNA processing enzyme)